MVRGTRLGIRSQEEAGREEDKRSGDMSTDSGLEGIAKKAGQEGYELSILQIKEIGRCKRITDQNLLKV